MAHVIGFDYVTLAPGAPDFTQDTYTQLVTDTLGDNATDADAAAAAQSAAESVLDAWQQAVQAQIDSEDVPSFDGVPFDTTILDAMLAELAVADATETGIDVAIQGLFDTLGAWNDLINFAAAVGNDENNIVAYINAVAATLAAQEAADIGAVEGQIGQIDCFLAGC